MTPPRHAPASTSHALFHRARRGLAALLLALPLAAVAQTQAPAELEGIEVFVEQGMRDWGIPGLAVSVVKDDELAWARGFGVRRLGHPEPVGILTQLFENALPVPDDVISVVLGRAEALSGPTTPPGKRGRR